ncbi:hypothetical protein GGE07_005206 [Sinorhizobium terangae]|nr:hypothetical protein [Sinorhizobium terangae]
MTDKKTIAIFGAGTGLGAPRSLRGSGAKDIGLRSSRAAPLRSKSVSPNSQAPASRAPRSQPISPIWTVFPRSFAQSRSAKVQ